MRLAIVADDLTGAADAAVHFCGGQRRVVVGLDWEQPPAGDVVALDAASRKLPAPEAAARVAAAVRVLAGMAPALWYKKVDSTLRGHLAAELGACLVATGAEVAVLAPAYPAQGRTTLDGLQHGVRWEAAPEGASRPPFGHLPTILRADGVPAVLLPLTEVRRNRLIAQLGSLPDGTVAVCDAVDDADLDAIAAAAVASNRPVLLAGSAGLAAAVGRGRYRDLTLDAPPLPADNAVAIVVGTLQDVTRRQLDLLQSERRVPTVTVLAEQAALDAPAYADTLFARMWDAVAIGEGVVITTGPERLAGASALMAAVLGELTARLVTEAGVRRLVLTGGDVAHAACAALGVSALCLLGQVAEGVPVGQPLDHDPAPVLVTKAGGFGGPGTLLSAYDYLRGESGR